MEYKDAPNRGTPRKREEHGDGGPGAVTTASLMISTITHELKC
jgi:hypothetical protein